MILSPAQPRPVALVERVMPVPATIGNTIAPPRFLAFLLLFAAASAVALRWWDWELALMAGFDVGAALFLVSCAPLFLHHSDQMRALAARNDANRTVMLLVSGLVATVILVAVAVELSTEFTLVRARRSNRRVAGAVLIFANAIRNAALRAIFYTPGTTLATVSAGSISPAPKARHGRLTFSPHPGVAVQTADSAITSRHVLRVALIRRRGLLLQPVRAALSITCSAQA